MIKLLFPLALMTGGLLTGTAQQESDFRNGVVELQPGDWNWSYQAELAGLKFAEENRECLPQTMSRMSVQEIMDELVADLPDLLRPSCSVSNIAPTADGFGFKMNCTGAYTGNLTGTYTRTSDKQSSLIAQGTVTFGSTAQTPFKLSADAVRQGPCDS